MIDDFRPNFLLRHSFILLLATLALLILSAPFVEELHDGDLVEAVLISVVMICSVVAVGVRRRTLIVALALVVPSLGGKWASHFIPGVPLALFYLVGAISFFAFVIANIIRFILRVRRVDANVLCAGLSGYFILGLLWLPAYVMVARLNPAAFNFSAVPGAATTMTGFTSFYFSFMTLTTVGYGDITPVSKGARMLAVLEAISGLFYVAVLISRLVAIYTSPQPAASEGNPPTSGT